MNLRAALAFVLLVSATPASAQWTWLNPKPQGHTLNDIEFLDDNTAIAVGNAGTIVVTHDAGLTWSAECKVLGVSTPLRRIARVDATTAVVVGDAGVAIKTIDAGAHWLLLTSPANLDLLDVDFLGASGVVAGGLQVLRTDDGGMTWFPLTAPGVGPIRACELLTPTVVLAAGQLLVRSTNGGQTWEGLFITGNNPTISFSDANHGAFTGSYSIQITTDGGVTWTEHGIGPGQSETSLRVTDLAFRDAGLIAFSAAASICDIYSPYRCSSYGEAQFSTNGALWWTIDQVWESDLYGVAVNGGGVMLFVGRAGAIARRVPPAPMVTINARPSMSGSAIAFAGSDHGLAMNYVYEVNAIGQTEQVYTAFLQTANAGESWTESTRPNTLVNDASFAPTGAPVPPVYAVGSQYNPGSDVWSSQVLKSINGGATWSSLWSSAAYGMLHAMGYNSPSRSVAVGDGGTIAITDNDVVTPSIVPGNASLRGIAFADPSVAVAVGFSGTTPIVLRTIDGGGQWSPIAVGGTQRLHDVDFATNQIGVAVGLGGAILRTEDAGESWQPIISPTTAALNAVAFCDNVRGYVAGSTGTVLETSDAGLSWTPILTPTLVELTDVYAHGTTHAVFVGVNQIVLDYEVTPVPTLISSFSASPDAFAIDLSWSVRNDADLAGFRVERTSGAGASRAFRDIGAASRSFTDDGVEPGVSYEYVLVALDRDGTETYSAPVRVTTSQAALELLPNVPNPFNPSTTIRYVLPVRADVRVTIYDVAGRPVATLVDRNQAAGSYAVEWNGTGARGERVASGVYLLRMEAGKQALSRKMVLLK